MKYFREERERKRARERAIKTICFDCIQDIYYTKWIVVYNIPYIYTPIRYILSNYAYCTVKKSMTTSNFNIILY